MASPDHPKVGPGMRTLHAQVEGYPLREVKDQNDCLNRFRAHGAKANGDPS